MKIATEKMLLKNKFSIQNKNSKNCHIKSLDDSSEEENFCSKTAAKKSVKYYLQNSTLHGLKYIAEDKITTPERIFFGLAFVLVIIISGFFISNVYVKWSASPIIITTSAKQILTTQLPFPAITICNLNQAQKTKVKSIARSSEKFTLLMSLCNQNEDTPLAYVGFWKYFKTILIEVAQPCDKMLLYCSFGAKPENCSVIFHSVLTDDGLCCTFNALDPEFLLKNYTEENRLSEKISNQSVPIDWTPEKGYDEKLPPNFYPRIPGGTGSRMGLTVVLNVSSSEYYCTKSKSIGFKVLVHNPAELPKISNYGILVTAGREVRIPIEPIYENAVPSIRSISKHVRRCLFSDEGDLAYYRTYSRKNCELECEAKILMEKCKCVLYYLPRIDPQSKICGPNDNRCTDQVQTEIESSDSNITCANCWPGCFELNYRATLTASSIVYGSFLTADDFPPAIFNGSTEIGDMSILHFYYLSNIFRSTTKSEMFGFTEFLSNTGGLLGLFMGFSIFSLIEIIYYISVRPYCASRSMDISRQKKLDSLKWLTPVKRKSYRNDLNSRNIFTDADDKRFASKNYKYCLRKMLLQQHKPVQNDNLYLPYVD